MQADGEHLGLPRLPFAVKRVEAVLQILEELFPRDVARCRGKAHVVGFQRVGDNKLVMVAVFAPVGQIVVIGVGNPGEAAGLGGQARGVHGAAAGIPALRRFPHNLFMQAEAFGDLGGLIGLGHIAVVDPFQAMRRDFPICGLHRGHLFGVPC